VIHSATFWNQNVHAPLIEKIFKDLIVNFPFNQTWIQYRKFLFPPTEPPNTEKRNTYLFFLKKVFFKSYIKELTMKVGSDVFYK